MNGGAQSSISGWAWTLVGGYAAVQERAYSLDVIGGFRLLGVEAKSDWQLSAAVTAPNSTLTFARSGSAEKSQDIWAGIVGAKGRAKQGASDWFVNYYADIGGASNVFTWQGVARASGTRSSGAISSSITVISTTARAATSSSTT